MWWLDGMGTPDRCMRGRIFNTAVHGIWQAPGAAVPAKTTDLSAATRGINLPGSGRAARTLPR